MQVQGIAFWDGTWGFSTMGGGAHLTVDSHTLVWLVLVTRAERIGGAVDRQDLLLWDHGLCISAGLGGGVGWVGVLPFLHTQAGITVPA